MQFLEWDFSPDLSLAVHVDSSEEIRFTRAERSLIQALISYRGRLWSRDSLLDAVAGIEATTADRSIDYLVNRVRRKLGDSARRPQYIETRYGEGYVWIAGVSSERPTQHAALPPVRTRLRGAQIMSYCDRPDSERLILHRQANRVLVRRLRGFLFHSAAEEVLKEARETISSGTSDLILDFRDVQGVDETAASAFCEIERISCRHGVELALSSVRPVIGQKLSSLTSPRFQTLDRALESREARILSTEPLPAPLEQPLVSFLVQMIGEPGAALAVSCFAVEEIPAGTEFVRAGETTRDMFFLEKGTSEILLDIDGIWHRASRIWPGTLVGEIGYHCGGPRTVTVRALDACRVVRLTPEALTRLEDEAPAVAVALHKFLASCAARRLIFYNDMIVDFFRGTLP
jgi:DNA-binding winged helix-turn-helix (wHTH) protein/anti-anti-sigma regulatory factor